MPIFSLAFLRGPESWFVISRSVPKECFYCFQISMGNFRFSMFFHQSDLSLLCYTLEFGYKTSLEKRVLLLKTD